MTKFTASVAAISAAIALAVSPVALANPTPTPKPAPAPAPAPQAGALGGLFAGMGTAGIVTTVVIGAVALGTIVTVVTEDEDETPTSATSQ